MADFLLTVGIDTVASLADMQDDITKLAKGINSTPIKIKAEFDQASLNAMRDTITQLSNLTTNTGKATSGGAADVTGIRKTASAYRALDKAMQGAVNTAEQAKNIVNTTERAASAVNKMNTAASKTTLLTRDVKKYYDALKQIDNLTEQLTKNQEKWTAASKGATKSAYERLGAYKDDLGALKTELLGQTLTDEQYDKSIKNIRSNIVTTYDVIKTAGKDTKSWGDRIGGLGKKFATWFGTTQIIMTGVRAVKDMVKNVAEIDSAMIDLRKVTDETDEAYDAFLERATKKSQEMGVSIKDNIKATAEFARLGNTVSDSEVLAEAAIVYKNVGDIETIEDASASIISTMQAFKDEVGVQDVMKIVDKFNEVGNKYAISSAGIGEALLRSSSAMKSAGNTLDETIALTTAANTIIQNPESVGTTLKTVSMYLRAAKTEAEKAGESTDGMAASVSELREELMALTGGQVNIQSDDNTFKSTYQILKELSDVWKGLTDISKANILEMVGGKRNANVVAALLENFSVAEKALQTSLNSDGSAMKEYEKWLDSVEAKQLQLKAAWEGLSVDFLSSDFVKLAVDGLRALTNGVDAVVDAIGGFGVVAGGTAFWGLKKFISTQGAGALLPLLTAIPAPALAVVAGLTAIGVAAYKIKKHSDNLKIGATLAEDAEQIKEHADNIAELNKLMSEVEELELVIDTPTSTQEQIDSAKARLEEIAALVNDKYELNIKADTDELKAAVTLLTAQQRTEMLGDVDDYIGKLNKTNYKKAKSSYPSDKEEYERLSQMSSDLDNLKRKYDTIYPGAMQGDPKLVTDLYNLNNEVAAYFENMTKEGYGKFIRDASAGIYGIEWDYLEAQTQWSKTNLDNTSDTIKNFDENSIKSADYLAKVLASDISINDAYGIDTSVAKFEQLGKTLTEAGANTDYMSKKFAIAKQGVTDLQSAIDNGKLDSVVEEYINFKTAIGDTSKNAVHGAALLKQGFTEATQVTGDSIHAVYEDMKKLGESKGVDNFVENAIAGTATFAAGFNTLPDVIDAGDEAIAKFLTSAKGLYEHEGLFTEDMGLEEKEKQLTSFAQKIGLLKNKSAKINVETGEVSVITDMTKKIFDLWGGGDKTYVVTVDTNVNSEDIDDYEKRLEELNNQDCNIRFEANGESAKAVIGDTIYMLEDYDESTGTATLYAEDGSAVGTIDLVNSKITLLPNKKVITIEATTLGTEGIDEYAAEIDKLIKASGGGKISFNLDVNGNTEVLNEAGKVIARLEKNDNVVFHVNADGNLEVINTLTEEVQILDKYGNVQLNVYANVENFGTVEGLKGDLEELNGQECSVVISADNTPAVAVIGETSFAIADYNEETGTATIYAENGEAIAVIDTTTNTVTAIPDKTVNVDANVNGTEDVENLDTTIEGTESKDVEITATTPGADLVEKLKKLWDGIQSKSVSIFANIFGDIFGDGKVDGTAHADGTAFAGGKKGNWGTKGSGIALGGELGQELVVRDGRFFTIGDRGAEFFAYKKDDIIFNAEQTKQIFEKGRITHGKTRGRALASGTSFATGNMDLFSARHTLDASAQIIVEDISLDPVKLDEALEETLKEMQSGIDGAIGTYAHNILLAEKDGASGSEIIAIYKKMQQAVHDQANKYREKGLDDNSEYIQKMQKQWWEYQESINKIIDEGYENNRKELENAIGLDEIQMEKAVASRNFGAVSDYTNSIIGHYKKMQESLHDQAEYYRGLGYSDTSDEVSKLSQLWIDYQKNIDEVVDKGYNSLVEKAVESVESIQKVYDTLKSAAEEYSETGKVPVDVLTSLSEMGMEYVSYLKDENGMLSINKERIDDIIAARTKQLAVDTALSYVEKLRLALTDGNTTEVNRLVSATESASSATWDLVYANLELLNLSDNQYAQVLDNINKIRSLADSAAQSVYAESGKERSEILKETEDALETILDLTMDLIKAEVEQGIEALEKQKEKYREIIDLKKEALETTKEENDYNKEVAKKVSEIAKLQSQINQLSLDDSREAQAEKAALEEELAELQTDLSDYQADYSVDKQQEMLDKMADSYEDEKDKEIAVLEESISSTEKLYQLAIDRIESEGFALKNTLIAWNEEYGSSLTSEIEEAWNNAKAALAEYNFEYEKTVGATTSAAENIGKASGLGSSTDYGDPKPIINQMRNNSLQWFTASDSEQKSLEKQNSDYASQLAKIYGKSVDFNNGSWYLKGSSNPIYSIGTWEAVDYITNAMRSNSAKWENATESKRAELEKANEKMAKYIAELSGQKVWKDSDGVWWIDNDKLYESYGTYHTGGVVGDSSLKKDEVMAILKDGELVLDEKREEGLYKIVDFAQALSERLGTTIDTSGFNNLFGGFSLLPTSKELLPSAKTGSGFMEFSPSIEVNISHNGSMSDNDARRYGGIIAETALGELKDAFTKKGFTNIGNSALK